MPYRKNSQSLVAASLVLRIVRSLWNLIGTSAVMLSKNLSNCKAIRYFQLSISRLRNLTRSYKTFYQILNRGPGQADDCSLRQKDMLPHACVRKPLLSLVQRMTRSLWAPGPWFNIKMLSYQYRKSQCGDMTILRLSYIGVSDICKTTSLYWIWALLFTRTNTEVSY